MQKQTRRIESNKLLTFDAYLKRRLLAHLKRLGFLKAGNGYLLPPSISKRRLRVLHSYQKDDRLRKEKEFVASAWPQLKRFFAEGSEVDPEKISPRLELVRANTAQSNLFRLASLTWSVPVSQGYGRRMRFLVWDEQNSKLIGLIALGDPVFNLRVRDEAIGWTLKDRERRLVNVLDAYVLGAVPPYSMLLGGKLVASLLRTREIRDAFRKRYSDSRGVISKKRKRPSLVMITTTSALGRSAVYNRLSLNGYPANQIQNSAAEIAAARSNMYGVVRALHDPNSRVLSGTLEALRKGSVVVVDISLLSSGAGNMLAGLILRRIFAHNQENFTAGAQHPIIPVIAAVEEAQSVLGRNLEEGSPYVEWVKEGRKYDLGAILVTQQPGSLSSELLSQADNWFCFHLLSEGDASALGKFNSHYSEDVLAHLIGEPIPGNCFMWSAPHQPFVLPVRVRSFEETYRGNIKAVPNADSISEIRAQKILVSVSEAMERLKKDLIAAFKGPGVKFVKVPAAMTGGEDGVGVYSGQLYHLIKELKTPADTQSEDQLKMPLMSLIFGEGKVQIGKHPNGREYYCAAMSEWTRILGKEPKLTDA